MARNNEPAKDITIRIVAADDDALASLMHDMTTRLGIAVPADEDAGSLADALDGFLRRPGAIEAVRPALRRCGARCRRLTPKGGALDAVTDIRISLSHDGSVAGLPVLDVRIAARHGIHWDIANALGGIGRHRLAWTMTTKVAGDDGQDGLLIWGTTATITGYDSDICVGDLGSRASDRLRRNSTDLFARAA